MLSSVMKVSPKVVMTSIDEYLGKCLIHNSIKLSMFAHSFSSYLLKISGMNVVKKKDRTQARRTGNERSVVFSIKKTKGLVPFVCVGSQ